jgi:hypothetical protein
MMCVFENHFESDRLAGIRTIKTKKAGRQAWPTETSHPSPFGVEIDRTYGSHYGTKHVFRLIRFSGRQQTVVLILIGHPLEEQNQNN